MERDIARLKSARPRLASRIERAEHILVAQLSTTNGSRPVKVRVHADGSRSYAVRSGSKLRRSYLVDQSSFSCEYPDHRRRQAALPQTHRRSRRVGKFSIGPGRSTGCPARWLGAYSDG
jgi:hypothetical protein